MIDEKLQYSSFNSAMHDKSERIRIAHQIVNILRINYRKNNIKTAKVLDMGCSTGIMSNYFSNYFSSVIALDVDEEGITFAKKNFKKKNLKFLLKSATESGLADRSFDIIICNQIYYWIFNQKKLFSEINRLLKPGGICFLGARNRYTFWDAQYYLPLLSILPQSLANVYVRVTGRADKYNCKYLSYWQLEKLTKHFKVFKITPLIIKSPKKYGYKNFVKYQKVFKLFPLSFFQFIEPLMPNFIWVLQREK